jgi:diadenylate cyclase
MFESILCQVTEYGPDVLESLIGLAVEIAREGREGRRVGTLFTLGDEKAVLARSRSLILDPLLGHPESSRHVTNLNLRGTIKELAQLDGGFVVSREGIVLSACRYLDAVSRRSGRAVRTRQPSHRRRQHERSYQSRGNCRL